jgi:hypothetical protein
MRTIRIRHHHEDGYGWSFSSPDLPGLIGGPDNDGDYAASCRHAESAVRFSLKCDAEERGELAPPDVAIEHFVPTSV